MHQRTREDMRGTRQPRFSQVRPVSHDATVSSAFFGAVFAVSPTSALLHSGLTPEWRLPRRARGTIVSRDRPTGSLFDGKGEKNK